SPARDRSFRGRAVRDSHQRVEVAINAFGRGEIVVVTDDDDRENEGDLFVAASHCTPKRWRSSFAIHRESSARRLALSKRAACILNRWWPTTKRHSALPSRSRSMSAMV